MANITPPFRAISPAKNINDPSPTLTTPPSIPRLESTNNVDRILSSISINLTRGLSSSELETAIATARAAEDTLNDLRALNTPEAKTEIPKVSYDYWMKKVELSKIIRAMQQLSFSPSKSKMH